MSIDLTVSQALSANPTQIADQDNNQSGLFLTNDATKITAIRSTGKFVLGVEDGTGGVGEWIQNSSNGTASNFGISFFGNSVEQMRLTNSGQLGIGTTTPSATLDVNGSVRFEGLSVAPGSSVDLVADNQGNVFLQGSSERFKENISELKDDFSKILSLNPISFQSRQTGETGIGYIAEDLQAKDLKNLVSYDAEGNPFSVHYKLMPVYLLEVLKEQQKMIKKLQAEMAELKASRKK
ncbi:MAG TPA: tail fiber domain-containing protein [Pyrinomonadaceae bacterium]|jgi:hypothetical protein